MSVMDYVDHVNDQMRRMVLDMGYAPAEEFGLDRRAAYRLWADEDCIVVDKDSDRTLQYYGGFEYVDKESRTELGDYVIYSANDDRVRSCLETYFETEREAEEDCEG